MLALFLGIARLAEAQPAQAQAPQQGALTPTPPGAVAAGTLTATLPTLPPTITPTPTFLPLPAVTFRPTPGAPTPALLALERPGGGASPPKDRSAPALIFLRRWGLLLALGAAWLALGLWLAGVLALLGRKRRR